LTHEAYDGAFSSAATRVERGDWFALTGCLYESDGRKIEQTERQGTRRERLMINGNPAFVQPPESAARLAGTTLLLSSLFNHYGHFLIETMSKLWFLDQKEHIDRIAFFPINPGIGIATFVRSLLEPFGIRSVHRLIEPTIFDRVIVAEDGIRRGVAAHPAMRSVFDKVVARYGSPPGEHRLFLSRAKAPRQEGAIANAGEIEDMARSEFGFEIVRPEDLPLPEQVARISSAAVVAGFAGSALHSSVFMRQGSTLIELADGRPPPNEPRHMQLLCTALSRCTAYFVPLVESHPAEMDVDHCRESFAAILRESRNSRKEHRTRRRNGRSRRLD
jgi:capsular polysaccharide biosynthesis protein